MYVAPCRRLRRAPPSQKRALSEGAKPSSEQLEIPIATEQSRSLAETAEVAQLRGAMSELRSERCEATDAGLLEQLAAEEGALARVKRGETHAKLRLEQQEREKDGHTAR